MTRTFTSGPIAGVVIRPLAKFIDERGWLAEIWREDESPALARPVMSYVSVTRPGFARGPHEHVAQTDRFIFLGPGDFKIYLWDNRPAGQSATAGRRMVVFGGENKPIEVVVPPGVVHAYKNVSDAPATVINLPDALYAGTGKKSPVDEIRHEADAGSPFQLD